MASLNELKRRERDLQEEIYKLGSERTPKKSELLRQLREVQSEIRRLEDQSK